MILEDDALDGVVVYCTAVEDITYTEVVCELVLESLLSSISGDSFAALYCEIIECEIISRICGDDNLELCCILGSLVGCREVCPLAALYSLVNERNDLLLACLHIDCAESDVEYLILLGIDLYAVLVLDAAPEV